MSADPKPQAGTVGYLAPGPSGVQQPVIPPLPPIAPITGTINTVVIICILGVIMVTFVSLLVIGLNVKPDPMPLIYIMLGFAGTSLSLLGGFAVMQNIQAKETHRSREDMREIHLSLNSRLTELVQASEKAAHAQGAADQAAGVTLPTTPEIQAVAKTAAEESMRAQASMLRETLLTVLKDMGVSVQPLTPAQAELAALSTFITPGGVAPPETEVPESETKPA